MIDSVIRYSAVTAKARAMYAKCFRDEDWAQLQDFSSLREMWEFLAASGAWPDAAQIPAAAQDPQKLTEALSDQLKTDCDKLCLYLNKKDAATLRFFLRDPSDGTMTPEEQSAWWHEGGARNAGLRRIAGAEADALNIMYILRLRRFPRSRERAKELLIPIRYKLDPAFAQRLLYAEDDATVRKMLEGSIWRDVFRSFEPGDLEKQHDAYMMAFCRRVLASARPGLVTAQAYMMLKNMERIRLVRAVGAIARGLSPARVV